MRILRARNLLLIVVFVYAVMTILFCVSEINGVAARVINMRSVISLAADMSVSQALASDEFFNDNGEGSPDNDPLYAVKGVTSIRTAEYPTSSNYDIQNIFSMVYDINVTATESSAVNTEKKKLYDRMYGKNSTSAIQNGTWMSMALKIRSAMPSLGQYGGTGDLPNMARLGLLQGTSFLAGNPDSSQWLSSEAAQPLYLATKDAVVGLSGKAIPKGMTLKQFETSALNDGSRSYYQYYNEGSDWLHLFDIAKTYTDSYRKEHTYYLAPTNVGITYLDPYILETAFVSNMDLLMRGEIVANGGTLRDGVGIVSNGMGGAAQVTDSEYVDKYFIINNGKFSFVKGQLIHGSDTQIGGWTGGETVDNLRVLPKIDYMCIDVKRGISEPYIRTLMFLAVGLKSKYYHAGTSEADKVSAYKKWLDSLGLNSESSDPYYVMIARVTFYVDAFTSYNTTIARDLYSMFVRSGAPAYANSLYESHPNSNAGNDLFQMRDIDTLPNGASGHHLGDVYATGREHYISNVTGLPYYMYTTYYAVMP